MLDPGYEAPISKKELVSIDMPTEMQRASDHHTSATQPQRVLSPSTTDKGVARILILLRH